jgi:RibD C-terminal domain
MRKLILQMQTSMDGYVRRAGDGPNWQVWDWGPKCPWDHELKARFNALFRDIDTILLSRKILEGGYLEHWSQFARDHGDDPDFASDTVEYKAVAVRDDLLVLTWQEHIGSTIVHVLDFTSHKAYTAVTPAKGGFMRLMGRIDVKSKV